MTLDEVVYPGVGVYIPESERLEGSADGLARGRFQDSVKHLTIHVHDVSMLGEALSQPQFTSVETVVIDYRKMVCLHSLKWALTDFHPENLKILQVTSPNTFRMQRWEIANIRNLFKPLSHAVLDILGYEELPDIPVEDEVLELGGNWVRCHDDTMSMLSMAVPWFFHEIERRAPRALTIDCDNQLHPNWISGLTAEDITLYNVTGQSRELFEVVDSLRCQRLHITSWSGAMRTWRDALRARLSARGVAFQYNGD